MKFYVLQELTEPKKALSSLDEISTSRGVEETLNSLSFANTSLKSSGAGSDVEVPNQKIYSKLQFSFKDLQERRQKRLLRLQSTGYSSQKPYLKRYV